jgi:hypothetical protein
MAVDELVAHRIGGLLPQNGAAWIARYQTSQGKGHKQNAQKHGEARKDTSYDVSYHVMVWLFYKLPAEGRVLRPSAKQN